MGGFQSMKEICKNCKHCSPTYKGGHCALKGKKVKLSGSCEKWEGKK
jgi:hypothetical protein